MLNYRRSPRGFACGKAGKSPICFLWKDVLSEDVRRELIVKYSFFFNRSDRVNRLLTCY